MNLTELKKEIIRNTIEGYKVKTNFNKILANLTPNIKKEVVSVVVVVVLLQGL